MNKLPLNIGFIFILFIVVPLCVHAQIEEDFDNDGDVDGSDFAIMKMEFSLPDCGAISPCAADIHPFKYIRERKLVVGPWIVRN